MIQQRLKISLIAILSLLVVVNAQGSSENEESLTQIVLPQPQPHLIEENAEILMECRTDNDVDKLFWFHDDDLIDDGTDGFGITNSVEEGTNKRVSQLIKQSVSFVDGGTYSCRRAEDADANRGADMMLEVFALLPKDTTVAAIGDEKMELYCVLEGESVNLGEDDVFFWYRADGKEPLKEDETKYSMNRLNKSLTVKELVRDDLTDYLCGFTMNGQSFNTTVKVESIPDVEKFDSSKNLVQGDPLVLACDAFGVPEPEITWLKDEVEIANDDRVTFSGKGNSSLRIEDLDFDDRADYTCLAVNVHGNGTSTILVRVKDKLAALWPFLGICAEVTILCIIIFIYERRRSKKMEEEEQQEQAEHLTNSNDHKGKDDIRQRK